MTNALSHFIVTTDRLSSTRRYYEDGLKMISGDTFRPDPTWMQQLWGLDREYPIRSTLLKRRPDDSHGYIRLVEIEGANGSDIRADARPWDYGIFDLGFAVRDQAPKIAAIETLGFDVFAPPTQYEFDHYRSEDPEKPPYYVIDAVVNGPNHTKIDLLERFNPPYPYGTIAVPSGFSEVVHSLVVVEDMDLALHFFSHLLDIPIRDDFRTINEPQFQQMLKIPADETVDWGFVADIEAPGSFVELIRFHRSHGQQLSGQRGPLNYGIAGFAFSVDELNVVFERMVASGVEIVCAPIELDPDGSGPVRVFSCLGPSQCLCEIFESKS
jgi:hypothetical protein